MFHHDSWPTGALAMGSSSYMEGEFPIQPQLRTASPSLQASAFQALEGSMIQVDSTTKLLVSNWVETIHPWKLTWNPKMEVDGRLFSFSIGLLLGPSRSFSRVYNEMETTPILRSFGVLYQCFFFRMWKVWSPNSNPTTSTPRKMLFRLSIYSDHDDTRDHFVPINIAV